MIGFPDKVLRTSTSSEEASSHRLSCAYMTQIHSIITSRGGQMKSYKSSLHI